MSITNVLTFKTSDPTLIDARGPRFGAVITTIVLTTFLATEARVLLHGQLLVFALGAFFGLKYSPYGFIYSKLVKPRLRGEVPTEDVRPPQFAQLVGFIFAITATILYDLALDTAGMIVVGFALAAAFLNAAFNFCLGCEVYLLIARAKNALTSRK
ncbi:MAG: DUF4395 domain-containing protein [Candidatus Nanopelagicaceae bacterium]|jgi:hypothetical protein